MQIAEPIHAVYPLIIAAGPPYERGLSYGNQTKARVAATLREYDALFAAYAGLDWPTVTAYARRYEPIIAAFDTELIDEMHGIADGACVAFEDILAINVRTEVMYGLGEMHAADCTAFAALPEATTSGQTIIGQNWDWHPGAFECCVVLAMNQLGRPSILTVVEAGLLAKMGMNSAGIGLCTNAMVCDRDQGAPGIPFHVLLRTILNSNSYDDAVATLKRADRASSANFLIGSSTGQAIDLEVAPGGPEFVFEIHPTNGVIGHANCFVADDVSIRDETPIKKPLSKTRQHTMDSHLDTLGTRVSVEAMQGVLADHENHPNALCRHPLPELEPIDQSATVASMIMNLDMGTAWVASGQPCNHEFREFRTSEIWKA